MSAQKLRCDTIAAAVKKCTRHIWQLSQSGAYNWPPGSGKSRNVKEISREEAWPGGWACCVPNARTNLTNSKRIVLPTSAGYLRLLFVFLLSSFVLRTFRPFFLPRSRCLWAWTGGSAKTRCLYVRVSKKQKVPAASCLCVSAAPCVLVSAWVCMFALHLCTCVQTDRRDRGAGVE